MQYRPSNLLDRAGSVSVHTGRRTAPQGAVELCHGVSLELPLQTFLIVLADAPEELEGDAEKCHANAGDSEHGFRSDMPGGGEETGIDRIPVPDHLLDH